MDMKNFLVQKAYEAFRKGDYKNSLDLYEQLAELLGKHLFHANICICEKKLKTHTPQTTKAIPSLQSIRVAAVMDEFTYVSYRDTCQLLNLSIDNWERELSDFMPDFLFIESAWRGKNEGWNRKISQASPELLGVLEWCRHRNIPTMFWNKEDPVHYNTFLNTAKRFDFVFTTDLNCIGAYKRDLEHERVFILPFACNPVEHNPIEKYERKMKSCFAGSYYVRYPERARDLDMLLEIFLEMSGVDIYDRQFGKNDPNYAFPEKYEPLILGNLKYDEIDLAYKGYQYGINLNSVKYSPTMFARRVYELLASNTLVISNYSKGVRLFFGDLAVSSDNKNEVLNKIRQLDSNPEYAAAVKLAGLRKVLSEHTYENRFAYIVEKILGYRVELSLPNIHVVAKATNIAQLESVITTFDHQSYARKWLHILTDSTEVIKASQNHTNARIISSTVKKIAELSFDGATHIALINPCNYYGEHYLIDLAMATKYAAADIIAKPLAESISNQDLEHVSPYTYGSGFFPEMALISVDHFKMTSKFLFGDNLGSESQLFVQTKPNKVFYIDSHNFTAANHINKLARNENGFPPIKTGILMHELQKHAENIPTAFRSENNYRGEYFISGRQLFDRLNVASAQKRGIACTIEGEHLKISVAPSAESPYYIYTKAPVTIDSLWSDRSGKLYLETTPGLELSPVVVFLDAEQRKIDHVISVANWNQLINIPSNSSHARLAIRVSGGPGQAFVKNWVFDHVKQSHRFSWIGSNSTLLISPAYPNYTDYYRYSFVHRRVKNYKALGLGIDVFSFRQNGDLSMYEFEDVDVISGGMDVLNTVLGYEKYSTIAVHALGPAAWSVISRYKESHKIVIWLHGAEIQSWKRRMFNYGTPHEIDKAKSSGEARDRMWQEIFALNHPNIHFVFVSQYFANEVKEDLELNLNPAQVHVIPNPIDTNLFKYHKKNPEDRKRILSIRPYASKVYANDLMVKAVLELSSRSYFDELKFLIIGDGILFEETVSPLRNFQNVEIYKGFLSQSEIAALHREYGVFFCPSRMDTQGVSRDEAMASGLVPVTNRVGAIPEFVSDDSGFLCDEESYGQLADAIDRLYLNPQLFERMSESAAREVGMSRSAEKICNLEIKLLREWA